MLFLFQLLFVCFLLFAIAGVVQQKREGVLSLRGAAFWILFWILAGLIVVYPRLTSMLAETLGIGRGADLVIYISVAVLFYIVFHLHVKLEIVNRDVTKAVRRDAIEEETCHPERTPQ